jgi:hypothetical protein
MWSVTTSRGSRVDGIRCETDARRRVHMLGTTAVIGPYSWSVVDSTGSTFTAELRRAG